MDFSQLVSIFGYILTLGVATGLWWLAWQSVEARRFWACLAAGWTLNLLGAVVWNAEARQLFSLADGFYLGRYLLVGLAWWLYPTPYSRGPALRTLGVMAGAALVWGAVYLFVARDYPGLVYWRVGIRAVLDVGLVYLGWRRWRSAAGPEWRRVAALITLALLLYGLGTWTNLGLTVLLGQTLAPFSAVLWLLSEIFMAGAIFTGWWHRLR